MLVSLLSWRKTQAQVHFQQLIYIIKESTSVLLETYTLHHEWNLTRASFPCSTSRSALPKITLHCEANPLPRNTLHHEQKLAPFRLPYGTSTSALPKATFHREGNLTHVVFLSIVKAIQHMLAHFLAHAQVLRMCFCVQTVSAIEGQFGSNVSSKGERV